MISPCQHGFFPGRSTLTNLVCFTQFVAEHLDKKQQVDCIYLDLSKAFDTINHSIALRRLGNFGFSDALIQFFDSYLSDLKQTVVYNGFKSSYFSQTSGVPQCSTLGPLIFLIYINDLHSVIRNRVLFYADDIKIFNVVNAFEDALSLQVDGDAYIWVVH